MFALEKQESRWETLVPARGDRPAVEVEFPALPPEKAVRKAREASRKVLVVGGPDAVMDAGAAFTKELVRWSILAWKGIGVPRTDAAGELVLDEAGEPILDPVEPTHDVIEVDEATGMERVVFHGTISAFVAEPRLMDAADARFVVPFVRRDAEKNGFAPSPDGTSARATQGQDTARRSATRGKTDAVPSARTSKKPRKRKQASASGPSSSAPDRKRT